MARSRTSAPANKVPPRRRKPLLAPSRLIVPAAPRQQIIPPISVPTSAQTQWLPLFLDFLNQLTIESKETGQTILGHNLWGSQRRFLTALTEGLDAGVRDFTFLKSRQLGETTLCMAIDLFWLFLHPGIHGVFVVDEDGNRDKFRVVLRQYARSLPKGMRYEIVDDNKTLMSFNVGGQLSILDFIVAGKRKSTLGASRAYRFAHLSEVANYGDETGLENFLQTLSENHPDRLFVKESTANGMNHYRRMCRAAKQDHLSQRFCFIGWWARDDQMIPRTDERFAVYMEDPWTEEELELQAEVAQQYGVLVTDEQLAWYRWRAISRSLDEGMLHQTQPWTEKQAFILSGRNFFPARRVEKDLAVATDGDTYSFKAFRYYLGQTIDTTHLEQVYNLDDAELKVWEEPVPWGRYAIGCDPAYGRADWNDSHAITVCRCYADRLVTVAEYGSSDCETFQVTWALAHLASMYEDCYINLEISGPGIVIMTEMRRLKQILQASGAQDIVKAKSWENALDGIRWYLYHRPDSLGKGYAYGWKALSLDTPLPTPTGWTTMGDVQVGDKLLSVDGKPCTVKHVSPVHINRPCYEVVFDDGTRIVADEDHEWKVARARYKGSDKIVKTKDLAHWHRVRMAAPLGLPAIDLPIHPYTLGVWLGDGMSLGQLIYSSEEDVTELSAHLQWFGEKLGPIARPAEGGVYRPIEGLRAKLKTEGLLGKKHIPEIYFRASEKQRLQLLQGLMDTDGSIASKRSRCEFSTSSSRLRQDFSKLLRTLGLPANFVTRTRVLNYAGQEVYCSPAYQFSFSVFDNMQVFRLSRKQKYVTAASPRRPLRGRSHAVVSVTPVAPVPVRCVEVDNPSHLYLAGATMIPTHNSNLDNKIAIMNELRDSYINGMTEIKSVRALEQMEYIVQEGADIGPSAKGRNHDDFVFSLAFAHRAWLEWIRPDMIADNYTFANGEKDDIVRRSQDRPGFVAGMVSQWFDNKTIERRDAADNPWARQRGLR